MNKIPLGMSFISALLFFTLISVNPAPLGGKAFAQEDQATPMPPLPPLPQLPNMGDNFQKDIHSNDAVSIGKERIVGENEVVNDAVVIGADLTVNGTVNGNAVCIGGDLKVGPQAVIKGDLVNIGGQLDVDPSAKTYKERVNIGGRFPFGFFKGMKGSGTQNLGEKMGIIAKILRLIVDFSFILFLLFFALLMTIFLPRQFNHIEEYLIGEFPRCTLLGIASMVGFPIIVFIFVITLVGILAVPFLLLAFTVSCLMGYVVFCRILGRKLLANQPIMLQILIGILLLYIPSLAGGLLLLSNGFIPAVIGHIFRTIGIIILICVNFIGLGAVIYSGWGKMSLIQRQADKPNNFSGMSGGANTAAA